MTVNQNISVVFQSSNLCKECNQKGCHHYLIDAEESEIFSDYYFERVTIKQEIPYFLEFFLKFKIIFTNRTAQSDEINSVYSFVCMNMPCKRLKK